MASLRKRQRKIEEQCEKLRQSEKEQRLRRVKEAAERDHMEETLQRLFKEKKRIVEKRNGCKRTLEEDPANGSVIQETFQINTSDMESLMEVNLSKSEMEKRLQAVEKRLEKARKERAVMEETVNACLERVDTQVLAQLRSCREEKAELGHAMEVIVRDIESSEVCEDTEFNSRKRRKARRTNDSVDSARA